MCSNGRSVQEARFRADSAMSAYSPLAAVIFGSPDVGDWLKFAFMNSLCLSRLFFNVHVLVLEPKAMAALNSVYMRILRRIGGAMRFSDVNEETDLMVRRRLRQPSLDCLLLRKRLLYLRRLLLNRPLALLALLQTETKQQHDNTESLAWTKQLRDDLCRLAASSDAISFLGDPCEHASKWERFIVTDSAAWSHAVTLVYFETSVLDRCNSGEISVCAGTRFTCSICPLHPSFASTRALGSHMRAKHGSRCPARLYINADAVCPMCGTNFKQRIRAIAHLSDRRRTKCWDAIVASQLTPLSEALVASLDQHDASARRAAHKLGSSHALSVGRAVRSNGVGIGRVTAQACAVSLIYLSV